MARTFLPPALVPVERTLVQTAEPLPGSGNQGDADSELIPAWSFMTPARAVIGVLGDLLLRTCSALLTGRVLRRGWRKILFYHQLSNPLCVPATRGGARCMARSRAPAIRPPRSLRFLQFARTRAVGPQVWHKGGQGFLDVHSLFAANTGLSAGGIPVPGAVLPGGQRLSTSNSRRSRASLSHGCGMR